MTVGQKLVTAEELLRIPDERLRRELVRGEVRTMAPDAAFVRRERIEASGGVESYWPPDLAVEGVSPNDRFSEVEEKVHDWVSAGTRMVLVVDPKNRTVTARLPGNQVAIFAGEEAIDGGQVVPGWSLPVADGFR